MEQTVFTIGEKEYNVVKKGVAQARQVSALGRWLSVYGAPAIRSFQADESMQNATTFDILVNLLGLLSDEALLELFSMIFGCGMDEANEYFEVDMLVEGMISLYQNQPAIKRLANRFFSAPKSKDTEEDSSTPSE